MDLLYMLIAKLCCHYRTTAIPVSVYVSSALMLVACAAAGDGPKEQVDQAAVSDLIPVDTALKSATHGAPIDSLVFVEVARLGPATSTARLRSDGTAASGISPFLAIPRMALSDKAGRTLVLDPAQRVVFVFDSLGTPVGRFGGSGEGPGELIGAAAIDVGPDGQVAVLDLALRRVTVYSPDGALLHMAKVVGNGIAVVLHDSVFDVLTEYGQTGAAVRRYSFSSDSAKDLLAPTPEDRVMARAATIGWAARGFVPDQTIYFSPRPGTFRTALSHEAAGNERGIDLFPQWGFRQLDNGASVPLSYAEAATIAGGVMSDGQTVFVGYYFGLLPGEDGRTLRTPKWGIAAFDSTGQFIAKGTLPEAWGRVHGVTPGPAGTLFVAVTEPEPTVIVARMTRGGRGAK